MKWIKIEDGCEMPDMGEVVVVGYGGRDWSTGCHYHGTFHPMDEDDYAVMHMGISDVTHWARVELPEE